MPNIYQEAEQLYSEEMQDIISKPPAWLLRYGLSLFFMVLLLICSLSAFIRYPDVIKTQLKINAANAPLSVSTKVSGKLVQVLVHENEEVRKGQILAYIESDANHSQVLALLGELKHLQNEAYEEKLPLSSIENPQTLSLGDLKNAYQDLYQSYLTHFSTKSNSRQQFEKDLLKQDLLIIIKQQQQLELQQRKLKKEYESRQQEYSQHQQLFEQKTGPQEELQSEESKLLSKDYPLQLTESMLMANRINYSAKVKEIMDLDLSIDTEKLKFITNLNSFIDEVENWKKKYVLSAPQAGKIAFYVNIIENRLLNANQEVFYIKTGNTVFYGEMIIPQNNMGKVVVGQEVLIKLKSYPYEEYGMIRGNITSISDIPIQGDEFISKVSFNNSGNMGLKEGVNLKNGMAADAEIITEDASLLHRLSKNIIQIFK